MTLFRAVYIRDGKPRSMTFAHESPERAGDFAERFVVLLKGYFKDAQLLTVSFAKPAKGKTAPLL